MPLKNNVLFVQEAMSKKRKRYLTVFNLRACHDLLLRRATFHSSEAEDTIQKKDVCLSFWTTTKEHVRTSCDSFHSHSPTQGEFTRRGESACLSACRQIDHVSLPVWSVTANEVIRLQYLTGHPTGAVQARGAHATLFSLESLSSRALYPNRPWSNNKNKKSIVFRALSVRFFLTKRVNCSEANFYQGKNTVGSSVREIP
ncbi:hypothetical protein P5673_013865 [Acropora cervicornis]|uniref:Uncharacterized protein n=1 Tax=Acropora cervicornis TaxID=6130 RepID=A0AAD9QKD6_ACRCE|nr:hypothetical protein P5673_013865 [Acropora cervicornis]